MQNMKNVRQSDRTLWCIYFSMTDMRYGKSLTITNMQIIITEIWFWSSQSCKIRCNVLSCTSVWKPIGSTYWGDITQHQISTRLLSIIPMLKLRTVKGCMAKCLAQLAACILPHVTLPISLTVTLPAITIRGAIEATKILSEYSRPIPSTTELVGTPSSMETASVATKISRGLALRDKGLRGVLGMGSRGALMAACFVEAYEHKLSLLANAYEDILFWSKCFSLYWWLSVVSSLSYF